MDDFSKKNEPYGLASYIRNVPDFPKPGIIFKDITPLLKSPDALRHCIRAFADRYRAEGLQGIAGIESRGFIFGAPLANELGVSFIPIRKFGKLPSKTRKASYSLEYGMEQIEIHEDAVSKGDRILIIDDLLATGGTAEAACSLVKELGGHIVSCAFLIELGFLNGRKRLAGHDIFRLIGY